MTAAPAIAPVVNDLRGEMGPSRGSGECTDRLMRDPPFRRPAAGRGGTVKR
ncbi:hypothetical protein GCM10010273_27270 [Streptomyces lavendulocolor]